MILFKSPLRRRIEKIRNELMMQRVNLKMEQLNQSLNPQEFARFSVKDNDLKMQIKLLDKILEK